MTKTKKKILTLALVALIVVMTIASASLAYFTDTQTSKNTFTSGNVKITLDEAPVDDEGQAVTGTRVKNITYGEEAVYPGATLDKDPTVHNTGKNPAYIRATVNVTNWMNLCAGLYPNFGVSYPNDGYEDSLELLVGELGEGWSVVGFEAGDTFKLGQFDVKFILEYDEILEPGEDTTPIFSNVIIPTNATADSLGTFTGMTVVAQAIQANGFDSWEDAFDAFDGN